MGNWNISINGVGCHHNGQPEDVDVMFHEFVNELRAKGHLVTDATFTYGGAETDKLPPLKYHVTYIAESGEWAVKEEGYIDGTTFICRETQQAAILAAVSLAGECGQVIVHHMDGSFSEESR